MNEVNSSRIGILSAVIKDPLLWLLAAIPLAFLSFWAGWNPILVFIFSAIGIIPLAGYIGRATEALAVFVGPRIGGLLNATLGNAAELIITLVAIKAGLLNVVKASITGSIIGNLLLVMGFAMIFGGARFGIQVFDRRQASNDATLLALAVLALAIPSLFTHTSGGIITADVEKVSLGVAVIMILLYAAGLVYSLRSTENPISYSVEAAENSGPKWSKQTALVILTLATIGVVAMSEILVGAIEAVIDKVGLSELFLGIILIPIIGNAAEHLVAVQMARRNQMDLSVQIAVSSSLQISLFVAPLLVFVSLLMGHPLTLVFNPFELIAVGAAVIVAALVSTDGESNWLEGFALLGVYLILGLAFFFLKA